MSELANAWAIIWKVGLATIIGAGLALLISWIVGFGRIAKDAVANIGKPTAVEVLDKVKETKKPIVEETNREAEEIRRAPLPDKLQFARRLMRRWRKQ